MTWLELHQWIISLSDDDAGKLLKLAQFERRRGPDWENDKLGEVTDQILTKAIEEFKAGKDGRSED